MILTILRTDEDGPYDLPVEVHYQIGDSIPPYLWGAHIEDDGVVVITDAWGMDGRVVVLTDAEIANLEQRVAEKLEMMG